MSQSNPFDQFDGPSPGVLVKAADPRRQYEAPLAQIDLAKKQADFANAPVEARKAVADARKAEADAAMAEIKVQTGATTDKETPTRNNALAGYKTAQQLGQIITDLEQKYQAGPGATSGLLGLSDYLPLTANQRFDNSGNAARGIVGSALGFTGGQLNTATEAAMAVGPYLPQSGDRDEVILDKIARLKQLQQLAVERSVSQLGGVPDANGRVTPVAPGAAVAGGATPPPGAPPTPPTGPTGGLPSPFAGNPGGGGGMAIATGATRTVNDSVASSILDTMIRQGATAAQINAALPADYAGKVTQDKVTAAQTYLRKNPSFKGSFGDATREVPTTTFNQIAASPFGAAVISAGDAVTGSNLDSLTADPEQTRASMALMRASNPTASFVGDMAGGVLGATAGEGLAARFGLQGVAAARAGDAAYGALSGAGSADDGNRLLGAGVGAAAGLGGGMFGRALAGGAGKVIRGVSNPDVQALRAAGVPLTVGQTAGGVLKGVEDRVAGLPVVGDIVNARRRDGFTGFNEAAFNAGQQALPNLGVTPGTGIREQGIDNAKAAVKQGYDRALNGAQVFPDNPLYTDLNAARTAGVQIPRVGPEFEEVIKRRIDPYIDPSTNVGPPKPISGPAIQDMIQGMRSTDLGSDAMGGFGNNALKDVENAVRGAVNRQAPNVLPNLAAADSAYRHVGILRDAVNAAKNGSATGETGLFSPAQLSQAAAANAKRFGGTQGTTAQPFFDLTRAGQAVLPSKVPDSGTAGREVFAAGLGLLGTGGIGAGAGYLGDNAQVGGATGLGLGAALALGGTRTGQRALSRLLTERPDALVRIGSQIERRRALGGMFGAGATPLLFGQ